MALRATGRGAHIRYATYTCHQCGKVFEGSMDTRYTRVLKEPSGNKRVFFCVWSCMSQYDKLHAAEAAERQRQKKEALSEYWRKWHEARASQKAEQKPELKAKPKPRKRRSPTIKHMIPKTVEEMRLKVEYYAEAANQLPKGTKERKQALDSMTKWMRRLKEEEECTPENLCKI